MNILITSAGRRVSLTSAFKTELVKDFPDGKVFTVDMYPELSSACRFSDKFFTVPDVKDPEYCKIIAEICLENQIKIVIPTIDTELLTLSENKSFFLEQGIYVIISDHQVVKMCRDKRRTREYFNSINFPINKIIDSENPFFPIFAKPYNGSSSIGVKLIRSKIELDSTITSGEELIYEEYLNPEYFEEFTVDMYFDKNNTLRCAVPRKRIEVRSGEVSKSVTRRNSLYSRIFEKFTFCPGFCGCITLQVFVNKKTEEYYGIEINPRFGGGYPLSYLAGANYPGWIIREYLLNEKIPLFENWEHNLLMLRYDKEIIINDYTG